MEDFDYYEHGKDADPSLPFLKDARVRDLTGNIGAEVWDCQLSKLNDKEKDQLALYVAQKRVVGQSIEF